MKIRKEVKIGLFCFAMMVLLFWGINFLKGKNIFTLNNTYYSTFDNVEGIKVSTDVMWRGMKVGSVTDIVYKPEVSDEIIVEYTVPSKFKIPSNSIVTTPNTMVISGKVIAIEPGDSSVYFEDGAYIPVHSKPDLAELAAREFEEFKLRLGALMDQVMNTLAGINGLFSEENLGHIASAMKNTDRLIATEISTMLANLNTLTAVLNENSSGIENIVGNLEQFTDSLASIEIGMIASNLERTLDEVNEILSKLNEGDGSLALLLNDDSLYESLNESAENLAVFLEDFQKNPRKYINLSIFGGRYKEK